MFDNIRDKFLNLQENITATLRNLSMNDPHVIKQEISRNTTLNLNAGVVILENFQSSWSFLNEKSQENAKRAQEVESITCSLHSKVEKQWNDIAHLTGILISLPEIITSVETLSNRVSGLGKLFQNLEEDLIQLENIIDTKEFHNKQLEQKLQLALHKETKLAMLESLKLHLEEKYRRKLKEEDKEKVFPDIHQTSAQENFTQDKKSFKENEKKCALDSVEDESLNDNSGLENIRSDNQDSKALDNFLSEG